MPSSHPALLQRRTMMVEALLSPPTVSLLLLERTNMIEPTTSSPGQNHHKRNSCQLCGCRQGLVTTTADLKTVFTLVGLTLANHDEEECSFCPSCSTQLVNLVRLKRKVDALGERLATMIIGLQVVLSLGVRKDKEVEDDDENALLQPFQFGEGTPTESSKEEAMSTTPQGEEEDNNPLHIEEEEGPQSVSNGETRGSPEVLLDGGAIAKRPLCPTCGKTFANEPNYKSHLLIHTGQKPFSCSICSQSFRQKSQMTKHLKTQHIPKHERPNFLCHLCPCRVSSKQYLKKHLQKAHNSLLEESSRTKKLSAEQPPIRHRPPKNVNRLKKRVHRPRNVERIACPNCDKTFSCKKSLRVHAFTHAGLKPFMCQVCNEGFASVSGLKVHRRSHTGEKPYVCDTCARGFSDHTNLRRHMNTVCGGNYRFPCPKCGKLFRAKANLKKHILWHLDKKSKCYFCDRLVLRTGVVGHLRTHTLERPYHCDKCGTDFTLVGTLNNHRKADCGSSLGKTTRLSDLLTTFLAKGNFAGSSEETQSPPRLEAKFPNT